MKHLITIVLVLTFSLNALSQQLANDTIYSTLVRSNWAFRADLGVRAQDILNQEMFETSVSPAISLFLVYKEFYFSTSYSTNDINKEHYSFSATNMDLLLGYTYSLRRNWMLDCRMGANITNVLSTVQDQEEHRNYFANKKIGGGIAGLGINRYFKLKHFNYLVSRFGVDYYSTNYNTIYNGFGKDALNYSLTIAYQGWFCRNINGNKKS